MTFRTTFRFLLCVSLTFLLALQAQSPSSAQVPGKRRIIKKGSNALKSKRPKFNLNASPSRGAKAAIAAGNAAITAAAIKVALDSFYQTGDRESFHRALGETRVTNANALLSNLKKAVKDTYEVLEYDPNGNFKEKVFRTFLEFPCTEIYLTKVGKIYIANLYFEAPSANGYYDVYASANKCLAPFNASIGDQFEYVVPEGGFRAGTSISRRVFSRQEPRPGLVRRLFEDAFLNDISEIRLIGYNYRTDKFGEDFLKYAGSFLIDRGEIKQIKNWNKISIYTFMHDEMQDSALQRLLP